MKHDDFSVLSRLFESDLKKPTALTHFQRTISRLAQRMKSILIYNAQTTKPDTYGNYRIRAAFARDLAGWTESNNFESIYGACREIKSTDIIWNFLGEDRTLDELRCSFLITLGISKRSGVICYRFHPYLEPIIRNPSVFAKIKLVMISVLARPKYAYSLYEYIADSYCRGKSIERISLEQLKEYLGIPPTSYTDYKTFKFQILKPNLAAISAASDYKVTYTTYREGRRVAGVNFKISRKTQWQQPLFLEEPMKMFRRHFG